MSLERYRAAELVTNVACVPFFPLGSAFGSQNPVLDHPGVRAAADELIPGTSSLAHLEENVGAGDLSVAPELLARLDVEGDQPWASSRL